MPVEPYPTVDLEDVELLRAGGPFHGHGSPPEGDYLDVEFLDRRVAHTRAVAGKLDPPFKLGHNKEQRALRVLAPAADGKPAAGWLDPTTVRRDGDRVLGTLRRVPVKLARVIASGGFRKISAEWKPVTVDGTRLMPFVGVSALGEDLPAVDSLDDIIRLYEPDPDPGERHYAAVDPDSLAAAAAAKTPNGGSPTMDPKIIRAALGLPEDATDEQVQAKLAEVTAAATVGPQLIAALGVKDGESVADALARRDREAEERLRKALGTPAPADPPAPTADVAALSKLVEELRSDLAAERKARETLEADLPTLRAQATAGAGAAEEARAMSRATLIESWLRSGRMTPGEREQVDKDLIEDFDRTKRLMEGRRPDEALGREYGRSEKDPDPEATRKAADGAYSNFMGSLGFTRLSTVRQS